MFNNNNKKSQSEKTSNQVRGENLDTHKQHRVNIKNV